MGLPGGAGAEAHVETLPPRQQRLHRAHGSRVVAVAMIRRPVVIAGARPNFPKVAPLMRALTPRRHACALVHTGQHYDAAMSASFFECLDIPEPAANPRRGIGEPCRPDCCGHGRDRELARAR